MDEETKTQDAATSTEQTGEEQQTETGTDTQQTEQGTKTDGNLTLTPQELQSKIDSAITKAIKTREENLKRQQTEDKLKAEKKYEELLNLKEQELEQMKQQAVQAQVDQKVVTLLAEKKLNPEYNQFIKATTNDEAELQIINLERLIVAERKAALDTAQGGGVVLPNGKKAGGKEPESIGKRLAGLSSKTNEEAAGQFFK